MASTSALLRAAFGAAMGAGVLLYSSTSVSAKGDAPQQGASVVKVAEAAQFAMPFGKVGLAVHTDEPFSWRRG